MTDPLERRSASKARNVHSRATVMATVGRKRAVELVGVLSALESGRSGRSGGLYWKLAEEGFAVPADT